MVLPSRPIVVAALLSCSLLQAKSATIENASLAVTWDDTSRRLSITAKPSGRVVIQEGNFNSEPQAVTAGAVEHTVFGKGNTLEIAHTDGNRSVVMVFPGLPFALLRSSLRNDGTEPTITRAVRPFTATVNLGKAADGLKTLGTGGLLAPDKNPGSYAWLAVADPETRSGIVCGWLTHERGSGVVFSRVTNGTVRVEAQIDYGRLRLAPGATESLETLALGYFDDARFGLEAWADAVAHVHAIKLPPQPTGYCTWYSRPHGGASSEKAIAELSAFAATNLAPFGFSVVQIDDGWQDGISTNGPDRNFSTHRAKGPFPDGMKATAERITAHGLVPGLWFMPFAGTYYDPVYRTHPDWFVKTTNGAPYETAWGGTCLDMTHPGARAWLSNNVHRTAHEWGYRYFKMDGLWTGTGTRQQYINSGYKYDGIGDAVFASPDKSNLEAYRDGLRLVRAVAGPNVFFLGCCAPQNMRSYAGAFGLVDAMRVGPDNGAGWKDLLRGPVFGSRHYFLHGRVWYNDPDPVYVRANMPLKHAQLICSWVALSGQLNLSSEWLPGLPAARLDILKRTMPSHGLPARPVDLFENDPPRVWLLTDERTGSRRDVVGLFNWTDREVEMDLAFERIGLASKTEYLAFDYWQKELLTPLKERLRLTVPAQSCRVLAVRARREHPQIVSTSRHVTQGIIEVAEERWNAASSTLHGRVKIVGGDPLELRVALPKGASQWRVADVRLGSKTDAAGAKATWKTTDELLRVTLDSSASQELPFSIRWETQP